MDKERQIRITVEIRRGAPGGVVYWIVKMIGAPFVWVDNSLGAPCKFRVGDFFTEKQAEEIAEKHELTVIPKS